MGYESQKCTQAVQGGLHGGHYSRVLQSNVNIYFSPQPATPHLKLKLCLVAGRTGTRVGQPLTTQPVPYQSLFGTISFCLQGSYMSATSQARLNGVLGLNVFCSDSMTKLAAAAGKFKTQRFVE